MSWLWPITGRRRTSSCSSLSPYFAVDRQQGEVEKAKVMEEKRIPAWMDYNSIPSLRTEAKQKLGQIRPETLGQASRISGVSPADISLVMIWMKRGPQNVLTSSDEIEKLERSEACVEPLDDH